jgi:microcompartment protein CcmL/EutN
VHIIPRPHGNVDEALPLGRQQAAAAAKKKA